QGDLALHAGGEVGDGAVEVDLELPGQGVGGVVHRPAAQPVEEADQLPAGHVLVEAQLAGEVGDQLAGGAAVGPAVVPADGGAPAGGAQEAQQQAQGGGLAGPVGPEQADDLAGPDAEREVGQGGEVAVTLGEAVGVQEHGRPGA